MRPSSITIGLTLCLSVGCGVGSVAPVVESEGGRFELFVLGIAQDGGLPHFGCNKECCRSARREGRESFPAALGLHDRETGRLLLVEATPAVEKQVALLRRLAGNEDRQGQPVDSVLLTHAHVGHYTGLVHFGREVASTRSIPVHVSERMESFLRDNGPWSQLVDLEQIVLRRFEPEVPFRPFPGVEVVAVPVAHRQEFSDTFAFRIRGPNRTVLFLPDIDRWGDDQPSALLDGADVAYLDATFYDGGELPGRDLSKIPHPRMVETMRLLEGEARERPGRIRFLHLNHTNPALHDVELREEIEARGFRIAEEGERVGL